MKSGLLQSKKSQAKISSGPVCTGRRVFLGTLLEGSKQILQLPQQISEGEAGWYFSTCTECDLLSPRFVACVSECLLCRHLEKEHRSLPLVYLLCALLSVHF